MSQGIDFSCPLPHPANGVITLAHGGGGSVMHRLLEDCFLPAFHNPLLEQELDATPITIGGTQLAFTTDSFVVRPLFFPGGNIGSLAVYGTVNDLAMQGARPLYLSAAFVLEEGLPLEMVQRVVRAMAEAAHETGVTIATGDTKVIERARGEELIINTAGIGVIESPWGLGPQAVRSGDAIIVSGDLGRHGIAVMAVREGLEFEQSIDSDLAPLAEPVLRLLYQGIELHCLRDLTRGGLASALNELAVKSGYTFHIEEDLVPVREEVRGACEVLGLDPLYVANEGRFVAFLPDAHVSCALDLLTKAMPGTGPACIGHVLPERKSWVSIETAIGATRVLDMLSGEQLPRIC
ncbi:MAG: hydrogenase expression/formation protein HypE [Candidatus Hydrogenedentes bacterium]|nr:hydrogenase expression/formation protein HypE [Candidatus Hydrogenedentota bacterium]MBI3118225.1 hydrogenase expression/formation protein HypE [Candidatus Hydrogenedentota bacterium]